MAHPDDEVIACGGLLAKAVKNGGKGFAYIMTSTPERKSELEDSCSVLGIEYEALCLKEKEFGFMSFNEELLLGLEKAIAEFKPHVVVTHDPQYDYHADHRKTAEVVIPRLQSVAMGSQKDAWTVELLLAAEVNNMHPQPDVLVNITEVYQIKLDALKKHKSQLSQDFKKDYYVNLVQYKALLRGHQMGVKFAEAFTSIKQPLVGNFYENTRGPFL